MNQQQGKKTKENIRLLYFPSFRRRTKPTKAKQKYFRSKKEKHKKEIFVQMQHASMRVH